MGATVWPEHISRSEPLLRTVLSPKDSARSARRLKSSGGTDSLLPRVRAVLLFLQHGGHPDLILVDVPRVTNYWMKITGASESATRGVPEWLRNCQGRWLLHAQEPCLMVRKYIQFTLEAKLSTSDFAAATKKQP